MAATANTKLKLRSSPKREEIAADEVPGTRSIRRTCTILRFIGDAGETGVTLLDVANASKLPKSSAHRYLLVLEKEGFVERDDDAQRYRLGLTFVALHSRQAEWLVNRARPLLEKIRDEWDESVNLGMLSGKAVTYLDIVESPRAARLAARRGDRDMIHATALGKAIAATMADEDIRAILAATGMPRRTERTITDVDKFLLELSRVRQAGYAVDDCENENEGRCVAVYVPSLGAPVALSVSGLSSRMGMKRVPEVARSLMRAAADLSDSSPRHTGAVSTINKKGQLDRRRRRA